MTKMSYLCYSEEQLIFCRNQWLIDISVTHWLSFSFSLTFNLPLLYRLQRDKGVEVSVGGSVTTVPSVTSHPEEPSDLEELEQFARTFKQRRIKLGFTQVWRLHLFVSWSLLCFHLSKTVFPSFLYPSREMLAWPWGSCTAMISAKPPSPALRPLTWALRICASWSHCWRSGSMMQVSRSHLIFTFAHISFTSTYNRYYEVLSDCHWRSVCFCVCEFVLQRPCL